MTIFGAAKALADEASPVQAHQYMERTEMLKALLKSAGAVMVSNSRRSLHCCFWALLT